MSSVWNLSARKYQSGKQISQTLSLALSALKERENLSENAWEEKVEFKLSNDLTQMCFCQRTGWGLRVLSSRKSPLQP